MISVKLIELIEIHAIDLSQDTARDLVTNERTPGFRAVPGRELEQRLFEIFHDLGNWIGDTGTRRVRTEFEEWGHRRFDQGIPLSQVVYAVILIKHHLRRYIADHGVVDASFPRVEGDYVLPMHLHSLQDLNIRVGQFFDEAIYHLAHGYEEEVSVSSRSLTGSA
jgi:hypothetical protein